MHFILAWCSLLALATSATHLLTNLLPGTPFCFSEDLRTYELM